ncbi:MAG: hypothetical protein EOO08_00405 [Chitinophagaceae bacterium]|nr:MAG: hypothetical protein EOO08_00405 [Chitinophagaceae bacterium]
MRLMQGRSSRIRCARCSTFRFFG